MPALNQVIKNSQRITIVLFSDGSGLIHGTPFDKEINDLQKKYARECEVLPMCRSSPFWRRATGKFLIYRQLSRLGCDSSHRQSRNPARPMRLLWRWLCQISAPIAPPPLRSLIMTAPPNVVAVAAPVPVALAPPVTPMPAQTAPRHRLSPRARRQRPSLPLLPRPISARPVPLPHRPRATCAANARRARNRNPEPVDTIPAAPRRRQFRRPAINNRRQPCLPRGIRRWRLEARRATPSWRCLSWHFHC